MSRENWRKTVTLSAVTALTVAIHYGWVLEPLFGHSDWSHAIHSRLCYVPIVMGASWFGLRGALLTALGISLLIQPYIFLLASGHASVSEEFVEIVFYFAIALLTGGLIDRESRIKRQQEQTQLQLERSHKFSLIGRMAAGIAHEVKNPLASIKGAVEILGDENATKDEKKEFQGIIVKEIKRIDGTVQEFLDFARPKEIERRRINLSDELNSTVRQFQNQVEKAGLRLRPQIADNVYVRGDAEKIRQVIINLLLNAIDVSRPGKEIALSLTRNGQKAIVTVEDFGAGMQVPEIERIFDPFYTTKTRGSGLGLAIVKSIVEGHNGQITVESKLGEGTRFILTLPQEGKEASK